MPPKITTTSNEIEETGNVPPFAANPKKPAMEFTKINNAETAAVCLMVAQPKSNNTGLNIIPPPIPSNPDKNPIAAPIPKAIGRLTGFKLGLPFPKKPSKRATATINTVPKMIL